MKKTAAVHLTIVIVLWLLVWRLPRTNHDHSGMVFAIAVTFLISAYWLSVFGETVWRRYFGKPRISVHYHPKTNILTVAGLLSDIPEQRKKLENIFSKLGRDDRELILVTENLGVPDKSFPMWIELTEKFLSEVKVHYLWSSLSMILGYGEMTNNPKHTFDLDPPVVEPSRLGKERSVAW